MENENPETPDPQQQPSEEEQAQPVEAAAEETVAEPEAVVEAVEAPAKEEEAEQVAEPEAVAEVEAADADAPELPSLDIGSQAANVETGETEFQPTIRGKLDKNGVAIGTGRRKTSVARVRIQEGSGQLTVNGRSMEEYLSRERDRKMVEAPLKATDMLGKVDVSVRVSGGGTTGQTGAIVLGVARALEARDNHLHEILSSHGFLTRDGRMVERKKYGFRKARRSFQFSKR